MNTVLKTASVALLLLPLASPAQTTPPAKPPAPPVNEITVRGKREKPEEGLERKEIYDERDIDNANAFTVKELVDGLPPGPAGTQPVILVDGKETSLDLSTLPPEMVQRIEVHLDGERPDGAPRAEGHVINVMLLRNYAGANLNARQRGSFAGGGGNMESTAHGAYKRGELNIVLMAKRDETFDLLASERDFSRQQDRTAAGGRDFRLPWGETASVQALAGTLGGLFDGEGNAVSTAIAPRDPPATGLTPGDFTAGPAGVTSASGLQRFNSSRYQYLSSPSTSNQVSLNIDYPLTPRTTVGTRLMYRQGEGSSLAPPPVTAATNGAIVPGAYNPFGQDIAIGMVHTGFGAVRGGTESRWRSFALTGSGLLGEKFKWNAEADLGASDRDSATRELDPVAFSAALAQADAALRFDPFAVDDSLYSVLSRLRTSATDATNLTARASLSGAISDGWVEPVFLTLRASYAGNESERGEPAVSDRPAFSSASKGTTRGANGSLDIPLFKVSESARAATLTLTSDWSHQDQRQSGTSTNTRTELTRTALNAALRAPWVARDNQRAWLYRMETEMGVGRRSQSGQDSARTSRLSALWAPFQPLSLRVVLSEAENPPRWFFDYQNIAYNQTLFDRRRDIPTATNVEVVRGIAGILSPAFSRSRTVDVQLAPPDFERLTVGVTYNLRNQGDILRQLSAQDVIDNEAALPGRVTRAAPTTDDIAAGQPGAIVRVDTTPLNAGRSRHESVELSTRYRGTEKPWGSLDFSLRGEKTLERTNELLPGVPFVTSSERDAPPDWTLNGSVNWRRGPWSASGSLAHRAEGYYAGVPYAAYRTLDLGVGHTFRQPFIGKFGRRAQLRLEVGNLLDEDPPLVDTLNGYLDGASPLGRTYQIQLRVPLGNVRGGGGPRRGGQDRGDGEEGPDMGDPDRERGEWNRDREDFPARGDFPRRGGGRPPR